MAVPGPLAFADAPANQADPWWGTDKALHLGASVGLASTGYGLGAVLWPEKPAARWALGASLAVVGGAAKELLDLGGWGHPSWRDMTWNVIGAATGLLLSWLVDGWWPRKVAIIPSRVQPAIAGGHVALLPLRG